MRWVVTATAICVLSAGALGAQDKLAQRQQQEARDHYRKGEALMLEESFEKAATEFRMATRLDPGYTLAFYSLGQTSMILKRYDDAAAAYEACRGTILAISGFDTRTRGEARQERADELLEIEAALERWGGQEPIPGLTTMRLMERRRLLEQQAEKDSISAVEAPAELSLALGSAYYRLGRLEEAEREFLESIEAGDETGAAHNNVAVILMTDGRLEEAKRHLVLAEESGFRVNPRFKEDLKERIAAAGQ